MATNALRARNRCAHGMIRLVARMSFGKRLNRVHAVPEVLTRERTVAGYRQWSVGLNGQGATCDVV